MPQLPDFPADTDKALSHQPAVPPEKMPAVASDTWLQVPEDLKEASAPQSAPVCLQRHLPFPTLQIWIVFLGKMPFIIIINRSHHKSILRLKVLFHFSGMQAFPRLHASLIRHIETDVVIPVVLCHIASPTFCLLFPDVLKAYSSNTHSPLH